MTFRLVKTCNACPEQYGVFLLGQEVGYLRLRHGFFTADCDGATVYAAETIGDGSFHEDERDKHLTLACLAIQRCLGGNKPLYTVEEKLS